MQADILGQMERGDADICSQLGIWYQRNLEAVTAPFPCLYLKTQCALPKKTRLELREGKPEPVNILERIMDHC